MLASTTRQLRYALTLATGRRINVELLHRIIRDIRQTLDEFGGHTEARRRSWTEPDARAVAAIADRDLRRAVHQAGRFTQYYQSWFATHGIDPRDLHSSSFAACVPVTSKTLLRSRPFDFVSKQAEPVFRDQSTGTTGVPAPVWFSRYELELYAALSALGLLAMGVRPGDVLMSCVNSRTSHTIITAQRSAALAGVGFIQVGTVTPRLIVEQLAMPNYLPRKHAQVTHLMAPPSVLAQIVQQVELDGRHPADFGLRGLLVGGEILTDALRQRAEEALGAACVEQYMTAEIAPVGGLVCSERHLHMQAHHGLVEVVDPIAGRAARPGEIGTLTATPFAGYRETTLLLRYATGDLVRVLASPADLTCELRGLPATSRILGRLGTAAGPLTRGILEILQGERVIPLPSRYAVDGGPDDLTLHVVVRRRSAALAGRLATCIADRGLNIARLVLVEDPCELPYPCTVRADLHEASFESAAIERTMEMAGDHR